MNIIEIKSNKAIVKGKTEEYYNAIRTNIQLCGDGIKTILMTSSFPREGKSIVSINLAISFAKLGKKTLYIDADTRNSKFASRFRCSKKMVGLTNYLSGIESIDKVIYDTDIENFYIIPSGNFPPNPTVLLQNKKFNLFMSVVRKHFDYIIIDSPPVELVIDPVIIKNKCDAFILVVEENKSKSSVIKRSIKQLRNNDAKFLGVILNKSSSIKESYGGYGAYGAYGYYGSHGE